MAILNNQSTVLAMRAGPSRGAETFSGYLVAFRVALTAAALAQAVRSVRAKGAA